MFCSPGLFLTVCGQHDVSDVLRSFWWMFFVGPARQTLPQLVGLLNSGLTQSDSSPEYDSTMATALHSTHSLMKADPDIGKSLLNNSLINSLNNMSLNLWVHTPVCSLLLVNIRIHSSNIWAKSVCVYLYIYTYRYTLRKQKKITYGPKVYIYIYIYEAFRCKSL